MRILFLSAIVALFLFGTQAQYLGDPCEHEVDDDCYSGCCNREIDICDWPSVCPIYRDKANTLHLPTSNSFLKQRNTFYEQMTVPGK